ncbi:23777_t:CDS:2 [Cetraspora pellucida]|uniref:23777_t:CDS:1 n=1 Tax=Cetraspora pellucida TaxID=1433469 RepID=A0A9N8WL62_9GLOM|nr:23777_t:CDS:2 [Cetraspora pellucida]
MVAHSHSYKQNRKMLKQFNNKDLKDIDKVEDLSLVSTTSLLNRLKADSAQTNIKEKNEITYYIKFQEINVNNAFLE